MIRRRVWGALVLHLAYAGNWWLLSAHGRDIFERWTTLAAMAVAGAFYAAMVVAFWWARKSPLNAAFSIQKLYWSALVWLLAVPGQAGIAFRHAPYRQFTNPYAYWTLPGWARTYIWIGLTISTMGVTYEFFRANGLWPFRRRSGEDRLISIASKGAQP